MTQSPKTLVITGCIPGAATVGEILLQEMLSLVDQKQYVVASIVDPQEVIAFEATGQFAFKAFNRPFEHGNPSHKKLTRLGEATKRLTTYEPAIQRLTGEVEQFALEHQVERVWSILNMTSVNDLTDRLMPRLKLPLLAHVWDDMEHLCLQRNLDALTRRRTMKRFSKLLSQAETTAVICEEMAEVYTSHYKAHCQIVRHGVSDNVKPKTNYTSDAEFRIGFSGGMYSYSAWDTFLKSLDSLNWHVAGKRIRLIVMSDYVTLKSRKPAQIDFLGWRPTSEVHQQLANCDLLYLPQAFEGHQKPLTQLSFPTKLSAYVSVGRPVLVHSPRYGSLSTFYKQHPIGGLCQELCVTSLAQEIRQLAEDQAVYQSRAEVVARVAKTVLSRARFESQVRDFLNISSPKTLNATLETHAVGGGSA